MLLSVFISFCHYLIVSCFLCFSPLFCSFVLSVFLYFFAFFIYYFGSFFISIFLSFILSFFLSFFRSLSLSLSLSLSFFLCFLFACLSPLFALFLLLCVTESTRLNIVAVLPMLAFFSSPSAPIFVLLHCFSHAGSRSRGR